MRYKIVGVITLNFDRDDVKLKLESRRQERRDDDDSENGLTKYKVSAVMEPRNGKSLHKATSQILGHHA